VVDRRTRFMNHLLVRQVDATQERRQALEFTGW
jgi:hypothetical protein